MTQIRRLQGDSHVTKVSQFIFIVGRFPGRRPRTRPGDLSRPAPEDAHRRLHRGAAQGVRPRRKSLVPRFDAGSRETPDRDVVAPDPRQGLVLPVLPREGPHGGAGDVAEGHLLAHALQGRRPLRRRPEHERAFLVEGAARRLPDRVHRHAIPPGGRDGESRQGRKTRRDRVRLLRRGRDLGGRVLRGVELRGPRPAPRALPGSKQRLRDQRAPVGPNRLRDPHDRQRVQGELGRGGRHAVHRDVQDVEAAGCGDASRLRAAARRGARRAHGLALVLRRSGEVPHRCRARGGAPARPHRAHVGARAVVGVPRRSEPQDDARRDQNRRQRRGGRGRRRAGPGTRDRGAPHLLGGFNRSTSSASRRRFRRLRSR